MSALAEILLSRKVRVQGSDMVENANVKRLQKKGAKTFQGHQAENINGATIVVVSSAIKENNPELMAAKAKGLKIMHRCDLLASILKEHKGIAVAGAHGKTSTTALIWHVLQAAGLHPGVVNGGVLNALDNNACPAGQAGGLMVAEADESDCSFIKLFPHIAVVTNIDPEHMENYGSMENLRAHYKQFLGNLPNDGLAVLCADHPETAALASMDWPFKVVTYGVADVADIRLEKVEQNGLYNCFDVRVDGQKFEVSMPGLPGAHYALNALSAIAIAQFLGAGVEDIQKGLAAFKGVGRRFSHVGYFNKAFVIDDYAHHPVEIDATIAGAKACFNKGKIYAIIQPHRFSRLADLMEDFAQCSHMAHEVIIAPVHSAGEAPLAGVTHTALAHKMRENGLPHVHTVETEQELESYLNKKVKENDVVLMMGAGSISSWAKNLAAKDVS